MATPQKKIAFILGLNPSSISRELKRNIGKRGYRFKQADAKARHRRSNISRRAKKMNPGLIKLIRARLDLDWSPEQIAGRLRLEGYSISHESIYQYIREDKQDGGLLYKHLRRKGKKYNHRVSGKAGRGYIPNRLDIEQGPQIIEDKGRIGDWEGDTIIGAEHKGAIVSYVDRRSKFTLLAKAAAMVTAATLAQFHMIGLPVLSITYDNGKEFSNHEAITKALKAPCYFAKPYHSWERGLNEHTNGLVRQYLPKKTKFTELTQEKLEVIANKLNHRPRKSLKYLTPIEFLHQELAKLDPVPDG